METYIQKHKRLTEKYRNKVAVKLVMGGLEERKVDHYLVVVNDIENDFSDIFDDNTGVEQGMVFVSTDATLQIMEMLLSRIGGISYTEMKTLVDRG